MADWQPIESAPKDGTEIIAWGMMRGDYGYTPDEPTWTGVRWTNAQWQVTKPTARHFAGFTPTHWTPLPEPPK